MFRLKGKKHIFFGWFHFYTLSGRGDVLEIVWVVSSDGRVIGRGKGGGRVTTLISMVRNPRYVFSPNATREAFRPLGLIFFH